MSEFVMLKLEVGLGVAYYKDCECESEVDILECESRWNFLEMARLQPYRGKKFYKIEIRKMN